jgi:hypothetical protein
MGLLEPEWDQRPPTKGETEKVWEEIEFRPLEVGGPVAAELLEALRDARELGGQPFLAR